MEGLLHDLHRVTLIGVNGVVGVETEVGAFLHGAVDAIGAVLADNELLRADGTAHILLGSLVQSVDVLMVAVGKGDDAVP